MAEILTVLGGVGSIFSIVDGISKVIGMIRDLQARWGEADLTLLSLASQLTALRAASTQIQEWIDEDPQDTHHQLIMDLDVSISCCKLLMDKVESFFANLSQLTEKPLDLRDKWKVVFGSSSAEGVLKLIEHQTSALTLLLTACNCRTIGAQQRYLETKKTRKVLQRAKTDSVSLYVHRDTASLTSKMTDNLSKISRTFEFDSNVFSTGVYERAFRGSIKDILRRRQHTVISPLPASGKTEGVSTPKPFKTIRILGQDQIGMDMLVNAIEIKTDSLGPSHNWHLYQSRLQQLCLSLLCKILLETRLNFSDHEHMDVLKLYSDPYPEETSAPPDVLEACANVWRDATRLNQESHVTYRERFEFEGMIFWIRSAGDGRLSLTSGNYEASLFIHLMDRALPENPSELLPSLPRLADCLRAEQTAYNSAKSTRAFSKDAVLQDVAYQFTVGASGTVTTVRADAQNFGDETALVFFFDLQDYNMKSRSFKELEERITTSSLQIARLRPDHKRPMVGLVFRNFITFAQQVEKVGFPLEGDMTTHNACKVIPHVQELLESRVQKRGWRFSFVLHNFENIQGADLMARLHDATSGTNTASEPTQQNSGKDDTGKDKLGTDKLGIDEAAIDGPQVEGSRTDGLGIDESVTGIGIAT
ncbi:hypothetical protein BKA58DRAFT_379513 [Alternaria rosae]|uniref:uncharacterized protein n=1 Tax=Alternaria rosae TaxID=1187941 RepID=UPI001E8E7B60|nr:uncharacterized protein BKA58DRAFT_379513 [Alternaria rosae]KAH6875266.1 hypothetical protein BKA58DRAFT_379513 [Alternaria rosae]